MKKYIVLLVEDDHNDELLALRALTVILAEQIIVARDGQEALDYLFCEGAFAGRACGNPHVILLDLKLPKIDGQEVLRRIRSEASTKRVPVVILTSSQKIEDIDKSLSNGARQ